MLKLCLSLSPVSMQWWVWSGSGMGIGRGSQTPPTATPSSPPSIPSSQTSCTSDCTRSVWLQIAFQDVLITFQDVLIIYLSGPSEMSCIKSMLKYTKFSRILGEVYVFTVGMSPSSTGDLIGQSSWDHTHSCGLWPLETLCYRSRGQIREIPDLH